VCHWCIDGLGSHKLRWCHRLESHTAQIGGVRWPVLAAHQQYMVCNQNDVCQATHTVSGLNSIQTLWCRNRNGVDSAIWKSLYCRLQRIDWEQWWPFTLCHQLQCTHCPKHVSVRSQLSDRHGVQIGVNSNFLERLFSCSDVRYTKRSTMIKNEFRLDIGR